MGFVVTKPIVSQLIGDSAADVLFYAGQSDDVGLALYGIALRGFSIWRSAAQWCFASLGRLHFNQNLGFICQAANSGAWCLHDGDFAAARATLVDLSAKPYVIMSTLRVYWGAASVRASVYEYNASSYARSRRDLSYGWHPADLAKLMRQQPTKRLAAQFAYCFRRR